MKRHTHHRPLLLQILLEVIFRFNPAYEPVIPACLTLYGCAVIFSIIFVISLFQHTFMEEYGKLALSAWGFVVLMNFMEVIGDKLENHHEK